jgi:hypothetical protein
MVTTISLATDRLDKAIWRFTADEEFSVSSAYKLFFIANVSFACDKPIWKSKAHMK